MKRAPKQILAYIKNPKTWNGSVFGTMIRDELEALNGGLSPTDETLLGMLIVSMDTFIAAQLKLEDGEYVSQYSSGMAASPWYNVRMTSLDKALKLLTELGLVTRSRDKTMSKKSATNALYETA